MFVCYSPPISVIPPMLLGVLSNTKSGAAMYSRVNAGDNDVIARRIAEKEKLRFDLFDRRVANPRSFARRSSSPILVRSGFSRSK